MILLGIETATKVCGVALVRESQVLGERSLEEENVHAEKVLTLVDQTLADVGCSIAEVDAVAVSIGPGSFTGLRIGLSTAKGLSFALNQTLVGVPTLRGLAHRVVQAGQVPVGWSVLAVIDARRDEVYGQCFNVLHGDLVPLWKESDLTMADLLGQIGEIGVVATGDGCGKLSAYLYEHESRVRIRFVDARIAHCSAASVAVLGAELLRAGQLSDARTLEPLYIKDFYFKAPHIGQRSGGL